MGRFSRYLNDETARLPQGMRRIAYDADSQTYTFRDQDGSIWTGESGNTYGRLHLVVQAPSSNPDPEPPRPRSSSPAYSLSSKASKSAATAATAAAAAEAHGKPIKDDRSLLSNTLAGTAHGRAPPVPVPAPPYTEPSRRFTDFNQIVDQEGRPRDQPGRGLLMQVRRSLSTRHRRITGSKECRGTV